MNRLPNMIKEVLGEGKTIGFVIECEDESKNAKGTIFPPSKTGWSEVTLVAKRSGRRQAILMNCFTKQKPF